MTSSTAYRNRHWQTGQWYQVIVVAGPRRHPRRDPGPQRRLVHDLSPVRRPRLAKGEADMTRILNGTRTPSDAVLARQAREDRHLAQMQRIAWTYPDPIRQPHAAHQWRTLTDEEQRCQRRRVRGRRRQPGPQPPGPAGTGHRR